MYYLQSRYYDPEVGRFLNADGILGANNDMLSYNLFAYCGNNPVNMADETGHWPQWLKDIGNAVATSFVNFGKAVWATVQACNMEAGIGHGVRISGKYAGAELAFGNRTDDFNIHIGNGKVDIGQKQISGVAMTLAGIGLSAEEGYFHPNSNHNCNLPQTTSPSDSDYKSCPATTIIEPLPKSSFEIFGFEFYAIVGVNFSLSFDYKYWSEELIKIYWEQ